MNAEPKDALSPAEWAVACVLVAALEAGRISVESDAARDARLEQGRRRFTARTADERQSAKEAHEQLQAIEAKDRGRVVRLLRSGRVEAREWIPRLERQPIVRGACAMARAGAARRGAR